MDSFDATTRKNIDSWLTGSYDDATKAKVQELITQDPEAAVDAFYKNLSFGTGGLRGIMGVGTNRVNQYTVRAATQGLANYLVRQPLHENKQHSVLIGYDNRFESRFFAEESAKVLAANGIKVFVYQELRPTPMVSFGCREKRCSAALMITASHNPPEYNGYKVYWGDGAQVLPPHDQGIIEEVGKVTDVSMVKTANLDNPLIEFVNTALDDAYLTTTHTLQLYPEDNKNKGQNLKVVYTNLHGAGITMVPKALKDWGFTHVIDVEEQKEPDGAFPTVASPNPEDMLALELGIQTLMRSDADVLLATDPDTDRMGVVVMHDTEAVQLTGNQIACICLYPLWQGLTEQGGMPEKAAFVNTSVTTELFRVIAEAFGKPCFDVLTGFKYIGEQIRKWQESEEGYEYIFGGEESYGYLLGTHARDKDAIISCCLMCEAALHAKLQGKTLVDILNEIYGKYGIYREGLASLTYKGKAGAETMEAMMKSLRETPPQSFGGSKVSIIEDYLTGTRTFQKGQQTEELTLPQANVILFWLEDGSKVVVRPSGTEPKIKLYCGVKEKDFVTLSQGIFKCDQHLKTLISALKDALC